MKAGYKFIKARENNLSPHCAHKANEKEYMRKIVSLLLICTFYFAMISPFITQIQAQRMRRLNTQANMNNNYSNGLQFRLSEGVEGAETREKSPLPETDPLSPNETGNLLKRLPAIKSDKEDQSDFAKRTGSLPPPKTGKQIPVKFPADEQRGTPKISNNENLEVVRFSPEGNVNLAPDLSITFSQPMVAVTSQAQAAQTVPVQFSPALPEGNWRWLGTKTLMFDTKSRFPMATKFTAKIPAGTRSATGQVLNKDVVWTFTTPSPKVETMIPQNQVVRRDAIIFVSFDQAINPSDVIKTISVSSAGKKIPIRLATQQEIEKDTSVLYYAKQAQPNRWLTFRAVNADGSTENALPADSQINVTVEKGTPSAEGPLTTTAAQSFSFKTYGAMKLVRSYCGYDQSKKVCAPYDGWQMEFSNPIDTKSFEKSLVKIEPNVGNVNIYPSGNSIIIDGYKPARKSFTVTISGSLKDEFGQTLGQNATAIFKTGAAEPGLYSQGGNFVVLDPYSKPAFSVYSTNYNQLKVRIYAVQPTDWAQFQEYVRRLNYDDRTKRPTIPGKLISDKVVPVKNQPDEMIETRIELSQFTDGGFGNFILDVEPIENSSKAVTVRPYRSRAFAWAQVTNIGLDAFVDNQELVGFATDLKTGKSLSGVDLSIFPNGKTVGGHQSKISGESEEKSETVSNQSWWEWLTSWGTSDESINATEAFDENGEAAETEIISEAQTNQTGASGVLRLPLPETPAKQQNILIARRGKDVAFLPENTDYYWQEQGNWFVKPVQNSLRWFVFTDRNMYRPKEEVSVKGYIRVYEAGKLGDISQLGDRASGLSYTIFDSRNNQIGKGVANLNSFGAFDFKFKLPDNANLGYSRIELSTASNLSGNTTQEGFQIQEFRRPEYEVTAKTETEAPFFVKESANVAIEAKYYAGGGLANADVNWTVTSMPTNYTPPNRSDYTFGTWIPWWRSYDNDYNLQTTQNFKGVTDASGKHVLKIDFESANPPRPYNVSASAAVQDVNRQTFAGSTNLLVHPSALYVGIKTPRTFVRKGENIVVESIVTDIDGKLIANRDVEIKAVLKDFRFDKGEWKEEAIDEQTCNIKSAETSQKCTFTAKQGGRYTITARVMDDRERPNESELTIWIPGGKTAPQRNVEQEEAQLIPDKKDYAPNETAEILVISPFENAEGVLTLRRDGIVKTERFSMKESSTILRIPLEEKYLPNIYAQVDLVGASPRTNDAGEIDEKLAKRPAFASGEINLTISTASRKLNVSAEPSERTLEPGGETKVAVEVKDNRGEPVSNSEVAVVVVDESILALSKYDIANPLETFYTQRGEGVTDHHSRENVILDDPNIVGIGQGIGYGEGNGMGTGIAGSATSVPHAAMKRSNVQLAAETAADAAAPPPPAAVSPNNEEIIVRQNFDALAVFAPNVKTDLNGKAIVNVKLPDNLTRYRITAISVDSGKRFGKGESAITARQPLMVRPSAPRFMNFGDKIELPVVVQNQTDKDLAVDVAVRAANAKLTDGGGKRVVVRANDRAEVRFPVSAMKAGTARFQFAATAGKFSDAAEIELPVWTPATSEAFATYGTTDQNGAILQPIEAPNNVYPQFGGLEITTSSTQLQELTDAFIYLQTYPFECSEQVASRMISIAALQDVLKAFKAKEMPTNAELEARFARDVEILKSRQNENGYFGLWKREGERYKYPFVTAHVAHALVLAKAKGYKVPDEMLNKTKPYLKNIESHYDEWHKSPDVRRTISAYALYVRNLMGDKDAAKAKRLLAEAGVEKMPFEALGWILSVLADDRNSATEVENIKRFLMNRTTETAATANFVTDYGDAEWLIMYSNRRADGVLLEALIKADPNNDLIPKLVRGLLDHRTKGRWANTQENVFILLALDKYFNAYEKVTPDFVTQIWLGNAYAGQEAFKGRSVDSNLLNIPMNYLLESNGTANLILDKQGAGRLYYRIGMKYAPKNLNLQPADYGFTVLRKYEAIDNADDVKQMADGNWTIKSGARVRVRLTMVAPSRRYHVALVDNLPAGLEILNPELAVTEVLPQDTGNKSIAEYGSQSYGRGYFWWRQYWFEHQNFRDERAEAFSSLLWEGVYNYSYVARATTPGAFVVPPAKAEEMYHPETFGRTGTDFLKVE
ncbi:MAG TPA: alpha-2-macroglobulin family protein [Pyrinomonadaceae bacterium]|jgi:hypothetical protein